MRDPERIDRICDLIKEQWKKMPDQRLGQLLLNFVFGEIDPRYTGHIWNMEDNDVEKCLIKMK